ncbi:MAG TPA: 2Fe-2S iron-sulfur cluster-binding protein [Chloroflexota bacterium]|nr:2Fe-2S iron-sulfur cluster-binding protein [Chloroflexota bacterium]
MSRATLWLDGRPLEGTIGARLLDAILDAGVDHRHICGGIGFCTSCRVEVIDGEGLSPVSSLERERLGREAGRLRLACQTRLRGDARVRTPPKKPSRFPPTG